MGIEFARDVISKLRDKHNVTQKEVIECFANGEAIYLMDTAEIIALTHPRSGSWHRPITVEC